MAKVSFKNTDIIIDAEIGTSIADCIRKAGLSIETPCNCLGICGKCKVSVKGDLNEISIEEKAFINGEDNKRLACLALIMGDVEIELAENNSELKTIDGGITIQAAFDCDIKKIKLKDIDYGDSRPYTETLEYRVKSSNIYKKAVALDKKRCKDIYGVAYKEELLDIRETVDDLLGVSIDIGTTGISAYLVDLQNGEILGKTSCLNPQTEYGGDVLSRISFCINNSDGIDILSNSIINKLNEVIEDLVKGNYDINDVYRVTIAGNTTMLHILLGVDPITLAKAPYRPVFLNKLDINSSDLGVRINENGFITLLPSASAYVGADILSGVIATSFNTNENSAVFIDIGTNGEIVAISNGNLAATSTAAGPALEGMNISCGCRAVRGAIDSFSIDEEGNLKYTTIEDQNPIGICGSGLIDIIANLVDKEVILSNGRFNPEVNGKLKGRITDKKFYINEHIYISQKDIRQIQLAKGAIGAGVSMLLSEIGIAIEAIEEVVIAGAFGYHINPWSIKKIGIIPKGFNGNINFVGNSSVEGARLALINKNILNAMEELRTQITIVELSTRSEFQDYFVRELSFS